MAKQPDALFVPDYWEKAKSELMRRDRIMKKLIPRFGDLQLVGRGEPFVTLARSIVGQQISVKAAQSVWERLLVACPKMTPAQVIKQGHIKLAACGLSKRKAEYLMDLAAHFRDGTVHAKDWSSMDDEDVIAELIQIRGIGRWTAEMFLIFSLRRPDVWPVDDIGLQKAVALHYLEGERPTPKILRQHGERHAPWRTVATWYLWRSLDPGVVQY